MVMFWVCCSMIGLLVMVLSHYQNFLSAWRTIGATYSWRFGFLVDIRTNGGFKRPSTSNFDGCRVMKYSFIITFIELTVFYKKNYKTRKFSFRLESWLLNSFFSREFLTNYTVATSL